MTVFLDPTLFAAFGLPPKAAVARSHSAAVWTGLWRRREDWRG